MKYKDFHNYSAKTLNEALLTNLYGLIKQFQINGMEESSVAITFWEEKSLPVLGKKPRVA